jgi:hypothetical protein
LGSEILHGIRVELREEKYFSKSEIWDNSHFTGQDFEFFIFSRKGSMATGLRVEDRLDGATKIWCLEGEDDLVVARK